MRNYTLVRSKLVSRVEEIEQVYKQQKHCNTAATSTQVETTSGVPQASQPTINKLSEFYLLADMKTSNCDQFINVKVHGWLVVRLANTLSDNT